MNPVRQNFNPREQFERLFPSIPPPADLQFTIWLTQHSPEVVQAGLASAAVKNLRINNTMTQDHAVRFASSVMNRLSSQAQ